MIFREWDWSTVVDAFPMVFSAIWVTLSLTLASYLFALLFGFIWTSLQRARWKTLRYIVGFIMQFIRTTPPLVQLLFLYYALPMAPVIGVKLSAVTVAILGLGIHFSTYVSEIYRSGIESVPKGQWEAAVALDYNRRQTWLKIILPQALPPVIPMLGNYLIIMFKEVPLTMAIGIAGMLYVAQYRYGAVYYEYVEPLTIVAALFFLLSYPSSLFIRRLEEKMNRRFSKTNDRKEVASS